MGSAGGSIPKDLTDTDDATATDATDNDGYYDAEDAQRPPMPMAPPPLYPLSNDHSLPTPEEAVNLAAFRGLPSSQKRRIFLWSGAALGLALIIGFSTGISVSNNKKEAASSSSSSMSAEQRLAATKKFLISASVSSKAAIGKNGSPQFLAAQWIAVDDQRQVAIPASTSYDDSYAFVQRYALAVLYYATDGANWTNAKLLHFLGSTSECDWNFGISTPHGVGGADKTEYRMGVKCNGNGQVSQIFLPHNNMQGQLPPELNHLQSMEHFSAFDNALTGSLPDYGLWQQLNFLDLDSNSLTGTLGSWFNFPLLEYLDLAGNDFSGPFPSFDGATSLIEAAFQDNRFEGSVGDFNGATSLEILYLQNNNLAGEIGSDTLAGATLRELDVSNNRISGTFPEHFYKFQVVDLHNNTIGGELPPVEKSGMPLYFLSLYANQIEGSIPDTFGMLYNLVHLDLSDNKLSGVLVNVFDQFTKLEYLFLHRNSFDAGKIVEMRKLKQLKELSLRGTNRVGTIPSWIGKELTSLVLLDLHDNHLTGTIPTTLGQMTGLRFLFLNDNKLNGTIPMELANMDGLDMLSLQRNDLVDSTDGTNPVCDEVEVPKYYAADCSSELSCGCCSACCSDDDPSCQALSLSPSFDGGYDRTHYVFSENLKFSLNTQSPAN